MGALLEIPITAGHDDAQREAAQELAKAKYHQQIPPELVDWAQRVINRINDWFVQAFNPQGITLGGTSWVVIGIVVVVLVAIVVGLVWRFGLPRFSRSVRDAEVGTDESLQPEDYRDLAQRAAAQGDWRTAVQESFRAMVRELEIRTVIQRRPARTALETAALVARTFSELGGQLFQAATTFNEVVYGHRAATAADYELMRATETAVVERADAGYVEADA